MHGVQNLVTIVFREYCKKKKPNRHYPWELPAAHIRVTLKNNSATDPCEYCVGAVDEATCHVTHMKH